MRRRKIADASTIQEFLVTLGFKIDDASQGPAAARCTGSGIIAK
jgi:hypothetical protein